MTCERCDGHNVVYLEDGWRLCADCRDAIAEQQHEDRIAGYYGASTPQTIQEQYDAVKREER